MPAAVHVPLTHSPATACIYAKLTFNYLTIDASVNKT